MHILHRVSGSQGKSQENFFESTKLQKEYQNFAKCQKFQIFRGYAEKVNGEAWSHVDGESGKTSKMSRKSQGILCSKFGRHPTVFWCMHLSVNNEPT